MTATGVDPSSQLAIRSDRFTLLLVSGLMLVAFGIGAAVQSSAIYHLRVYGTFLAPSGAGSVVPRLVANLAGIVASLLLAWALAPERRHGVWIAASTLAIGLCGAGTRTAVQLAVGIYPWSASFSVMIDWVTSVVILLLSLGLGLVFVASGRRLRIQEFASTRQRLRSAAALNALQTEELRVRREVAEGLHGTVQHRLVVLGTQIEQAAGRLQALADSEPERVNSDTHPLRDATDLLRGLISEMDTLREVDVREMSQLLYPAGVEQGFVQAARMMMRRLPETIKVQVVVDEKARLEIEAVHRVSPVLESRISQRILMLRILEESISNALRHGHASELRLQIGANGDNRIVLVLDDNGVGLSEDRPRLNGLGLLGERMAALGGRITLTNGPLGGARVTATLPTGPEDNLPEAGSQAEGVGLA